ncbi:PQQ-binding-like beta-propeller repeat protein [Telluria mixta]|uniref:PQQ-binding-like beta-propeller repeat protein n=1 Tax=Telluria mixta TaxID=34071 RepID=A0ABT2BS08_9BURK|nr:PQQ-binding-like beta-propeller repeat protein [Telluria mixta]MCS0627903.1 PQQ-binding-like beta-propeller repeat protein [Telluria mixta]WEM93978.1 PQQ-binding-like beta-propeller repeat protein [Telluria mixta]
MSGNIMTMRSKQAFRMRFLGRLSLDRCSTAIAAVVMSCATGLACAGDISAGADWSYYHGNPGGTHYSTLKQINTSNVKRLQVAWTYDTDDGAKPAPGGDMQANPLIVKGKLYIVSPKGRVISLDAATGKELWKFDPANGEPVLTRQRLRGVSYWSDGKQARILATFGARLYSLDAISGKLDPKFGQGGSIDLREGLGREPGTISVSNVTPGAVVKDLIVMGSTGSTPGHIRAFDVHTGKMRWIFHTIPQPGEEGYDTWPADAWKTAMGVNNWAGMSVDPKRGLVYVPLASPGMGDKDFYGADRVGDNLFGNSLVALDAATGKRVWHFQSVRHDIWDRDFPAPPTLVTVVRNGKRVDAVAQITKSGFVFVLDRDNGKPLFPVESKAYPASDIPGEVTAPEQVLPTRPAPFARQQVTRDLLTKRTPEANAAVTKIFDGVSSRGQFDPPSEKGTIIFPGLDGGGEWGGAAYDPETGNLYVNSNEMAWILRLKQRAPQVAGNSGRAVFLNNCAACHREDRSGSPPEFPSLRTVGERLPEDHIERIVRNGNGRMPAFGALGNDDIKAVVNYLRNPDDTAPPQESKEVRGNTDLGGGYVFEGYNRFLDPDGYPAVTPPWGTLNAINLNSGEYSWKIPLGEYPELAARGLRNTGSENYGGPVVTAGGVLFIGATVYDNQFRAFDKRTGELLWQVSLPAAGLATPATYEAGGRQFVVIAAGGGKNKKGPAGGKLVAYALPR